MNSPIKTVRALRSAAGINFDIVATYPHAITELQSNKRRSHYFMGPEDLRDGINKMNTARMENYPFLNQRATYV